MQKTIATIFLLMTPVVACAEMPKEALAERDLGIAIARAREVRLVPSVPNVLWFRLSWGHYKPTRPEFVLSLRFDVRELGKGPPAIGATFVEAAEPIAAQISGFLRDNPGAPLEAAVQAVQVDRSDYREETCPAVRGIADQLRPIAATAFESTPDSPDLYHGEILQIEGYTDGLYFSFFAQENNPLFKWGMEAASSLKLCPTL